MVFFSEETEGKKSQHPASPRLFPWAGALAAPSHSPLRVPHSYLLPEHAFLQHRCPLLQYTHNWKPGLRLHWQAGGCPTGTGTHTGWQSEGSTGRHWQPMGPRAARPPHSTHVGSTGLWALAFKLWSCLHSGGGARGMRGVGECQWGTASGRCASGRNVDHWQPRPQPNATTAPAHPPRRIPFTSTPTATQESFNLSSASPFRPAETPGRRRTRRPGP